MKLLAGLGAAALAVVLLPLVLVVLAGALLLDGDLDAGSAATVTTAGTSVTGAGLPAGFALPAGTPTAIVTVVHFAVAQLGDAYVYGGTGPDVWDCSGLMQGAYAAAGIHIDRTTEAQADDGTPVPGSPNEANLLPGDLILIPGSDGTLQSPGHVGMYLGDNLLIQAPYTGTVVQISPLQGFGPISALRRIVPWPSEPVSSGIV